MSVRTWMKLVLLAACVFGFIAIMDNNNKRGREWPRRSQCANNLKQIALAFHNYHETFGAFPPAYIADASGKPIHSWRVLILPFLESSNLYSRYSFAEPWDGPNNIKLLDEMPSVFACSSWHQKTSDTSLTSYAIVAGPGTAFPGATATKFADVTDGPSDTLLIVEVSNVDIPWTAPRDLDARAMSLRVNDPKKSGLSSHHPGGAQVALVDGSCAFMWSSIAPGDLKALVTIAGGEQVDAEQAMRKADRR